jgi:hypothetical protein
VRILESISSVSEAKALRATDWPENPTELDSQLTRARKSLERAILLKTTRVDVSHDPVGTAILYETLSLVLCRGRSWRAAIDACLRACEVRARFHDFSALESNYRHILAIHNQFEPLAEAEATQIGSKQKEAHSLHERQVAWQFTCYYF